MASSCTLHPKVKAPDGRTVDSKLWNSLRKDLSYKDTYSVYMRTKDPKFDEKYKGEKDVVYDENGEPEYSSLMKLPEFQDILSYEFRKYLAEKKANVDDIKPSTRTNIKAADQRAISYNSDASVSDEFVAATEIFMDTDGVEKVHTVILPNTEENRERAAELSKKLLLDQKLRDMLADMGVSAGTISKLEQDLRVEGVTDFQAIQLATSGVVEVIRLAKGIAEIDALPEEFAHLIVEALQDNPSVQRLYELAKDQRIARAILGEEYERYTSLYNGDENRLAVEAVGTLVARHILAQAGISREAVQGYESARALIGRMIEAFQDKFSAQDEELLLEALDEADEVAGKFAKAILEGGLHKTANIRSITSTEKFYKVADEVDKKRQVLQDLIDNTIKRYAILESRTKSRDQTAQMKLMFLKQQLVTEQYEEGIYDFANDALEELTKIDGELQEIANQPRASFTDRLNKFNKINVAAKKLKRINDFLQSYSAGIACIDNAVRRGIIKPSPERTAVLRQVSNLVADLKGNYEDITDDFFVEFIKMFVGDGVEVPYGRMKGKKYTAEDIAKLADHDISFFDRWLDSMANSTDFVLRMMDNVAKNAKGNARLNTLQYKSRIDAAYLQLKKSGITDTGFMYDRDNKGRRTFNYISEEKAQHLPLAQYNYWKTMMGIKAELDAMLPENTTELNRIICIRKDLVDQLRSQRTLKGASDTLLERFRDLFHRTADDTEFGGQQKQGEPDEAEVEKKNILQDFEGHQVDRLAIRYINPRKGEKAENMSDDMNNTMLLYAQMCNDYAQMEQVISTLELVRDKMRKRPVQQTAGQKALRSVVTSLTGQVVSNYTKEGEATNIVQRMNDWFSSQVYSKYMKDEGEILGMNVGKLANTINGVTAWNVFAVNLLSGISNVLTGSAMMRIESVAGQFFNVKDTAAADASFWKEMPQFISEIGQPVHASKLALFDDMFNVMQEYESNMQETRYNRSRIRNLVDGNALYVLNNAGELWMQNRTAMALAHAYKLKDNNNKPINLWDALVVTKDAQGHATLKIKDGVTKEDGTTFGRQDIIDFTNKAKAINQRMHGIYNYEDRMAWQSLAVGRMALMFRKWIRPNLLLKYGKLRYNYDLQAWEEGYWRTAGNFFLQLYDDLKKEQFDFNSSWKNRTPEEKIAFRKVYTDVAQFLAVCIGFAVLKGMGGDDKDDDLIDGWALNQLKYQMRRLETELGATSPWLPTAVPEALTILKSPAAGIKTLESFGNIFKILNPHSWTTRIQSGRYKGKRKAYKYFRELPIFGPFGKTIYRALHPKEQLSFFTQND